MRLFSEMLSIQNFQAFGLSVKIYKIERNLENSSVITKQLNYVPYFPISVLFPKKGQGLMGLAWGPIAVHAPIKVVDCI